MKPGTYIRTVEIRKKQSIAMTGKRLGEKRPWQSLSMRGKNNPMWGKKRSLKSRQKQSISRLKKTKGFVYTIGGYIKRASMNHPFADRNHQVPEHRLVIEKIIGRYLLRSEICHHVNGTKDDNRPENLMVFKNHSIHRSFEENKRIKPKDIIFDGRNI